MKSILLKGGFILDAGGRRRIRGEVFMADGMIRAAGATALTVPPDAEIIDLAGKTVTPGFIDAHIHVESSMLSPLEFSRHAVRHGTTAILADPHEIANVFGLAAVRLFLDLSERLPLDMLVGIPSCVPATGMEQAGAAITLDEIRSLLPDRRVYGLAEMMNYPGIVRGFGDARDKVDAAYDFGKIVDGHCPGLYGPDLKAYLSNGRMDGVIRIMSDHEATTTAEALEKLQAGMTLALRYGSAAKDLDNILPGLLRADIGLQHCMLCSDDLSAGELFAEGHVDRIIRRARDLILANGKVGMEAATLAAIGMATRNTGRYLQRFLACHALAPMGAIAPGYRANLVVLESLETLKVTDVFHGGLRVLRDGVPSNEPEPFDFSAFTGSVRLAGKLSPENFRVAAPEGHASVRAKVIEVVPKSLLTRSASAELSVVQGTIRPDPVRNILKIAVFERHHATGAHTVGFVRGLGLASGAIASTIAHDSHNLVIAGSDDAEMARIGNHLARLGGGIALLGDRGILDLPLEIGGLMSRGGIEAVLERYARIRQAANRMGASAENLFMILSFLSLPVIPELRITDRGLVDVTRFAFTPLTTAAAPSICFRPNG